MPWRVIPSNRMFGVKGKYAIVDGYGIVKTDGFKTEEEAAKAIPFFMEIEAAKQTV